MAGLRRSGVGRLAALLALGMVASACSGSQLGEVDTAETATGSVSLPTTTVPAPAQSQQPDRGDDATGGVVDRRLVGDGVVVGDQEEPITLNPFAPGGDEHIVSIIGQTHLTGVHDIHGRTLKLIPEVVVELPTVDNGGVTVNDDGTMTIHYRIRPEATWSDGMPISGDDFQFTLDTLLDPQIRTDKEGYLDIVSSEAGPKSFSYTLQAPTVRYETMFDTLIPKHAVEGTDFLSDWNDRMWPSGGPFVFDAWRKGERLTLHRNERYWKRNPTTGRALPYLEWVVFRFFPTSDDLIEAFRTREVDVIQPPPIPTVIETLRSLEPEGAVVQVVSGPVWEHIGFSFGDGRLERNPDSMNGSLSYRKAVAHAIDKQRIVDELLAGEVDPIDSFLEVYTPSLSQGAWEQYEYDVEVAGDHLEAAKETHGVETVSAVFTTTSNNEVRVQLSRLLEEMLAEIGIEYTNDLEDSELFYGDTLPLGEYDMAEWAWVGAPGMSGLVEAMDLFNPRSPPPEGTNYYRWGVPGSVSRNAPTFRFASLRDQAAASVDEAAIGPLINEAEQILADEVVIIPLYARPSVAAVWGDVIKGFRHNPTSATHTWNIEEWRRTSD